MVEHLGAVAVALKHAINAFKLTLDLAQAELERATFGFWVGFMM